MFSDPGVEQWEEERCVLESGWNGLPGACRQGASAVPSVSTGCPAVEVEVEVAWVVGRNGRLGDSQNALGVRRCIVGWEGLDDGIGMTEGWGLEDQPGW